MQVQVLNHDRSESSDVEYSNDEYEESQASSSSNEYDSGETGQTNTGEEIDSDVGVDFSIYGAFFQLTNLFAAIGIFDSILIYRRIVAILKRMQLLFTGIKVIHKPNMLKASTGKQTIATKMARQAISMTQVVLKLVNATISLFIPSAFICVMLFYGYDATVSFFEIDSITELGLYQIFTSPVISKQFNVNSVLSDKQDTYNSKLLPMLTGQMIGNIESTKETLIQFNQIQFENITIYNWKRCQKQQMIASYVDTFFCINKYYNPDDDECDDCTNDFKAMCLSATNFINKETVTTKEGNNSEVNESPMAERRRYCQFKSNKQRYSISNQYKITYKQNDQSDANSTIKQSNWDHNLTLECPDGMIIFMRLIYMVHVIIKLLMM